jgi:hypothetical protein
MLSCSTRFYIFKPPLSVSLVALLFPLQKLLESLKSQLNKIELAHAERAKILSKQQEDMKNHCASTIQSYEEKTAQLKENRQTLILKHQAILEELEVSS